jgi:restriction system protein
MAVPDYQTFMLPVLEVIGAHPDRAISMAELKPAIAEKFKLSEEELNQQLPSGTQTTFANRLSWACVYMKKAGLLSAPRRAHLQITPRGQELLARKLDRINGTILRQFPEFVAFQSAKAQKAAPTRAEKNDENGTTESETPLESLEAGHLRLRAELADELSQRLKQSSPAFFETIVVELLVKMGYGGSRADAGKAIGRSGDGGVDGIIKEDRLGLDKPVGRPDVQQFAGALAGHGATKGIFITTSEFTKDARDYASGLRNVKLVLIDGEDLAGLMIDHNLGVATTATYEVKRIDSDYFAEGE